MEKTRKDIWIDEVMDSLDGMQRATPKDALFSQIEGKLARGIAVARKVPLQTVSLAAASIILLVMLNVFMLRSGAKKAIVKSDSSIETVVEYYGLNEQTINY